MSSIGSTIERTFTVTFVAPRESGTKDTTPTRKLSETLCHAIRRSGTRIMIVTTVFTSWPLMIDLHEKRVSLIFSIFLIEVMNRGNSSNF